MNKLYISSIMMLLLLTSCSKDNADTQESMQQVDEKGVEQASVADTMSPNAQPIEDMPAGNMDNTALLQSIVNDPSRADFIARNGYRNPVETLQFFDIQPTDTVVELWPGGGWYTSILAPYTKHKGQLYLAHWPASSTQKYRVDLLQKAQAELASNPSYQHVYLTELGRGKYAIAPANSVDAVLTFRNLHNWYMAEYLDEVIKASFDALKPGGTLGIVEHRAPEGVDDNYLKTSGYMTVSKITEIAQSTGFVLVASSEVNANPKDTKFHPKGVWSLPPSLRAGEEEKYKAIGESDRMTLRFVKPL